MSDSPYELQRLVTVGTFSTPWEAQIAQARLGSEGLHSLIANEHVIRMVALSNAIGGIQLKVREQDAEVAAAVLRRLAPLPEIYLITQDAAAPAPATPPASGPARATAAARAPENEGPAVVDAEAVVAREAANRADAGLASQSCPSCGGLDLRPERSSRLVLGVLPVSRRGFRCADCGGLWRLEELRGARRLGAGLPEGEVAAPRPDEDTALNTVARFHTPWEAHLARTLLESEGLRCCVLEERLPAVHLLSAEPVAYNRLAVRQCDAARAAELLARAWSYPSLVASTDLDDAAGSDPDVDADADADAGFEADGAGGHGSGADRGPGDPPAGR